MSVKGDPNLLQWSVDGKSEKLFVAIGKKSVLVFSKTDLSNPIEFGLSSRYGSIQQMYWYNDGSTVLLGFSSGFLVAVSVGDFNNHLTVATDSIGQELYQAKIYKSSMNQLYVSQTLKRCVTCGDNEIKVQELSNLQVIPHLLMIEC